MKYRMFQETRFTFTGMKIAKGNLTEKFGTFSDHWHPRIVAQLNGQAVKIAKVKGEFPWHSHQHEDEMFYVLDGELEIALRDGNVVLGPGEYVVIPKGVEHSPRAERETQIMMFEPLETVNTGNIQNEFTKTNLQEI